MTPISIMEAQNAAIPAKPIPARANMSSVVLNELLTYLTTLPVEASELSCAALATTARLLILPETMGLRSFGRFLGTLLLPPPPPPHGARAVGWAMESAHAIMARSPAWGLLTMELGGVSGGWCVEEPGKLLFEIGRAHV